MTRRGTFGLLAIAVGAALAAACSLNPKSDPTTYYVLSTLGDDPYLWSAAGLNAEDAVGERPPTGTPLAAKIGVGPLSFPQYLERTRMVTRVAENELQFSEIHRWAQPLGEAFRSALAQDLGFLLGAQNLILHPWYRTESPEYTARIDVTRFERDASGTVHLTCRWEVRRGADEVLASGALQMSEPPADATIQGSVAAQSRLVAALSRVVADEIRRSASSRPRSGG